MATKKAFTLSELNQIQRIDSADLLLVSDHEDNKYYSKKMTIGQFVGNLSVMLSGMTDVLSGQSMPEEPTQREMISALTAIWNALGGSFDNEND